VVLGEPVAIDCEEVVNGERLTIIHARPTGKELAGEVAHHRIRLAGGVIHEVERKLWVGVRVDGVDDAREPATMARIHELLEAAHSAQALVRSEVAERRVTPLDVLADVRERHQLERVDAQVEQVVELRDDAVEVAVELAYVELIDDHVVDLRRAEGRIGPRERRACGVDVEGRQRSCPRGRPERVGEPQRHRVFTAQELVAVEVPPGVTEMTARVVCQRDRRLPAVVLRALHPAQPEVLRLDPAHILVALVDDAHLEPIPLRERDPGQEDPEARLPLTLRVLPRPRTQCTDVNHGCEPNALEGRSAAQRAGGAREGHRGGLLNDRCAERRQEVRRHRRLGARTTAY
jgi:hypothetical protein